MRVFIVTQTFPPQMGGMEGVMKSLAEKYAQTLADPQNVVVLPDKPYVANTPYRLHQTTRPKPFRAMSKRRWLAQHLKRDDLVICDSWKSVAAVPPHQGTLAVLAHGQEYLKSGRRAKRVQKALNRASHIIASSAFTLNLIESGWQVNHAKTITIPPTYMLPDEAANPATQKNRTAKAPIELLSICRLEARKGLLQSLQALARLDAALPDWCWRIGGSGPQADVLAAAIASLGLQSKVTLLGRVEDEQKETLLAQADVFLMPSFQDGKSLEGFGISYAEAARFGVPSIAGTAGGAPEAVRNGETGWCVDTLNPAELDAAVQQALSDTKLRHTLGEAARLDYADRLSAGVTLSQLSGFLAR
jgi:glycosyltransferase involved in cell wall biosynthesis